MENKYYRYSLDRSSRKYVCPRCQHKTFVLYVDNETGKPLADYVGMCDRADNCAYHYPPKQYFIDNGETRPEKQVPVVMQAFTTPQPPSVISLETVQKSILVNYESNTLYRYLVSVFGKEATKAAFRRYGVGTATDGATIFWQWDERLKVRTGKIMHYLSDGHRDHDKPPRWAHTCDGDLIFVHGEKPLLKIKQTKKDENKLFNLKQCLFGSHLINRKPQKIAIVESEKTAIVASICFPDFVWLATGGIYNLQSDKCGVLVGKDVVLWPDLKATEKWKKMAYPLQKICRSVTVTDFLEKSATDEAREKGLDLADFLLDRYDKPSANVPNQETDFEKLKRLNPIAKTLIEGLNLKPDN